MPILSLQRQLREIGRIRIGVQVPSGNGRSRPSKLDSFRITSKSREIVDAAAELYGGDAKAWNNDGSAEFEVITQATTLDIIVPPGQPVSQWLELWSGGGCERRCDGVTNVLTMGPCLCPADVDERLALAQKGQACRATTRLNVILPALPDLGVFRLESHGYYAAVELAGAAEILARASETGLLIPARLRLEQRTKKVPGQATRQYAVPVIEFVDTRMGELGLTGPGEPAAPRLGTGRPALPQIAPPATSDFRAPPVAAPELRPLQCGDVAPDGGISTGEVCGRQSGHVGPHKNGDQTASWPQIA